MSAMKEQRRWLVATGECLIYAFACIVTIGVIIFLSMWERPEDDV